MRRGPGRVDSYEFLTVVAVVLVRAWEGSVRARGGAVSDRHSSSESRGISRATVRRAQGGCEQSWTAIYQQEFPKIFSFFRPRVHSDQAEDLAANVFAQAFSSIGTFEWRGVPFSAWLRGIARHELASHYRSNERSTVQSPPAEPDRARDDFLSVEVSDILDRLALEHRRALELRFVLGLSGQEAAEVMRRSHGAYRALLLRAMRAFRRECDRDAIVAPAPRRALPIDGTLVAAGA